MSELSIIVAQQGADADTLELWGDADSIALSFDSPARETAAALLVAGGIHAGTYQSVAMEFEADWIANGCACVSQSAREEHRKTLSVLGKVCLCQEGDAERRGHGWIQQPGASGTWKTRRV